ncbi:MAG: adenylate/guanylate cyclase domain-containing protein [Myxococcales bacterium]|nr:adenylate/guanylate cyclase domain-containing protein [Myxococcales bacterium]MBL0194285.1 adenylate/guanylate cyclase domain-containing protein [Myxococcales bacterium]HQY60785.1 adenylate/guanylate cyclase domain-containing protein [Polyangiaceae bacterium]
MAIYDVPLPPLGSVEPGATLHYLHGEARATPATAALIEGYVRALRADGVPVDRAFYVIPTLHPQVAAWNFVWEGEGRPVREIARAWAAVLGAEFAASPLRSIQLGTHAVIRRPLADPACPADFAIVGDLRADGFTDYLIAGTRHTVSAGFGAVSVATRAPGGFTDEALALVLSTVGWLEPILDAHVMARIARTLLTTYLGADAGARVLRGAVKRGDGEPIHAAVSFTDLRDFTVLSDRLASAELLALLNDYFDCVVGAVQAHGGEVLKFVGDAVLAVFRSSVGDERRACLAALAAAREAFERAQAKNAARAGSALLEFGTSIHLGEVMYGNIGGPDRLDFTVIGPAVNLASRIQGLCRALDRPLLVSQAFVDATGVACEDLGAQRLKGVAQDVHIWSPGPLPTT